VAVSGAAPAVGLTAQYTATATLSNGTTQNVTSQVTWQSSNTAVATVTAEGVVTAAGLGVADLRATYQSFTGVQQVNVSTLAPGRFAISTSANQGWSSIDVSINGQPAGTLHRSLEPEVPTSCETLADTRVVTTVQAGTVSYTARTDRGGSWTGTAEVKPNGCAEVRLTCTNRNCASAPTPPPPTSPTPPTPPAPPKPPAPPTPNETTQNIANYIAGLHTQTRTNWALQETALEHSAAAAGTINTGGTLRDSGNLYVSYVQSFVSQSLAYVGQVSQTAAIDRQSVSALFSTYQATDVTDARSFYSGAPFGLLVAGLPPEAFLVPLQGQITAAYAQAISQLP
jgi:hypothetical protein